MSRYAAQRRRSRPLALRCYQGAARDRVAVLAGDDDPRGLAGLAQTSWEPRWRRSSQPASFSAARTLRYFFGIGWARHGRRGHVDCCASASGSAGRATRGISDSLSWMTCAMTTGTCVAGRWPHRLGWRSGCGALALLGADLLALVGRRARGLSAATATGDAEHVLFGQLVGPRATAQMEESTRSRTGTPRRRGAGEDGRFRPPLEVVERLFTSRAACECRVAWKAAARGEAPDDSSRRSLQAEAAARRRLSTTATTSAKDGMSRDLLSSSAEDPRRFFDRGA